MENIFSLLGKIMLMGYNICFHEQEDVFTSGKNSFYRQKHLFPFAGNKPPLQGKIGFGGKNMYCHQWKYVSSRKKASFFQQKSVLWPGGNMFLALENLIYRGNLVFPQVGKSVYTSGKPAFKCSKLYLSHRKYQRFPRRQRMQIERK